MRLGSSGEGLELGRRRRNLSLHRCTEVEKHRSRLGDYKVAVLTRQARYRIEYVDAQAEIQVLGSVILVFRVEELLSLGMSLDGSSHRFEVGFLATQEELEILRSQVVFRRGDLAAGAQGDEADDLWRPGKHVRGDRSDVEERTDEDFIGTRSGGDQPLAPSRCGEHDVSVVDIGVFVFVRRIAEVEVGRWQPVSFASEHDFRVVSFSLPGFLQSADREDGADTSVEQRENIGGGAKHVENDGDSLRLGGAGEEL